MIELTFGLGEAVAAFDQTQREAACPRTSGTSSDRLLVEVLVLSLEGERKALDLAAVEGSETMADLDRVGAGGSCCPEPDRPLNRPGERAVASASVTDTDLGGDVCEIEMGHTTVFVERIGENSQHEGGRRAENPEPEPLDIARAGIVAEPIDQRIVPAQHVERWLLDGRARR